MTGYARSGQLGLSCSLFCSWCQMNFCTLPSFQGRQSHMSGCSEHPEPSLLQLKAAVFGHPPADMCHHNNVRATVENLTISEHSWTPSYFLVSAMTLRWADHKGLVQPVRVILLGTLRRGLSTAPFRATIFQKTFSPTECRRAWWKKFPCPCQ